MFYPLFKESSKITRRIFYVFVINEKLLTLMSTVLLRQYETILFRTGINCLINIAINPPPKRYAAKLNLPQYKYY